MARMRAGGDVASTVVSPGRWLPEVRALDGLRGVAVLLVVGRHAQALLVPRDPGPLEQPGPFIGGFLGVDLFFVLSGLLITSLLVREHGHRGSIALGRFWWHRALRLLPALYVLLAVSSLYAWRTGLSMETQWRSVRAALTYTSNWAWKWDGFDAVLGLGHLWSLAIEFQFYVVWPLVVLALLRLDPSGIVLGATTAAGVVLVAVNRAVLLEGGDPTLFLYQRTDTRIDGLLIGSLLALVWWRRARLLRYLAWPAWLAVPLIAYLVGTVQFTDLWLYRWGYTAIAATMACVVGAVVSDAWEPARLLRVWPLVLVGRVSYGLYLWHLPIFEVVYRYGGDWGAPVRVVVGLVASGVATAASWKLVESPLRTYRRRDRARHATPASTSGSATAGGARAAGSRTGERVPAPLRRAT
jgi:peptidoglycan/LPS O-acetylase OafA/YrhL